MLFLSVDVLLVKHLFDPASAGLFAATAITGKVIFYLTAPIGTVFLPVIAQKHVRSESYLRELLFALVLVTIPGVVTVIGYMLFPHLVVSVFFPKSGYESIADYIVYYGVFMLFFSINVIFANYYVAIPNRLFTHLFLIGSIAEIVGILLFHQTIQSVLFVLIGLSSIMCIVFAISFIPVYSRHEN